MATLRIDEETFDREREVVKEERRMRVENQPYGRLSEIIYDQAFTAHPYKHPPIGSMADLEAASIDDVREFYRTYYVPEKRDARASSATSTRRRRAQLVTRYFGRIPKAERPVPRDIPKEPPQTRERRVTLEEAWPLPGGGRRAPHHLRRPSRLVPAAHRVEDPVGRPELADLPEAGLRDGHRAHRLRRAATSSRTRTCSSRSPSSSRARRRTRPRRRSSAELDRLRGEPVTDHELQRAKNQFARDYMIGREIEPGEGAAARARGRDPRRRHAPPTASSTSS